MVLADDRRWRNGPRSHVRGSAGEPMASLLEGEPRQVIRTVGQAQRELAAGASPAAGRLPGVGIAVAGRVIGQAAR